MIRRPHGLGGGEFRLPALMRSGSSPSRKSDPYGRGVHWWKIKNRDYSQADDGRGELLNEVRRAAP